MEYRRALGQMSPEDEETVRWMGRLFRHYCIEGRSTMLSRDPLVLAHLQNPDFEKGPAGWSVAEAEPGSITFKRSPGSNSSGPMLWKCACVVMGSSVSRPSNMIAESKMRLVDGRGRRKRKSFPSTPSEPGGIAQAFGFGAGIIAVAPKFWVFTLSAIAAIEEANLRRSGAVLAFLGFLVLAAVSPGPTGAYARFVTRTGGSGAATVIEHAVLLPNQSVLILTTSMGVTTALSVGGEHAVELTRSGVATVSPAGSFLAAYTGAASEHAAFPSWFALFLAVPLAATVLGGRVAGLGTGVGEGALRGALAGLVYAACCTVAAWAATLVVPAWAGLMGGSLRLGPSLPTVAALALAWGVVGCTLGAIVLPRLPRLLRRPAT